MTSWKYGQPDCKENSALLQNFCFVLVRQSLWSLTSVLQGWGAACPQLWRVAGCGNYVRESELHRSCKMRDCVSISAVLHFTGDRDWKVVHSPARLLFWSESSLSVLPVSYWALVQSLNCPKRISVCPNALQSTFLNRENVPWNSLWPLIITAWRNNWF